MEGMVDTTGKSKQIMLTSTSNVKEIIVKLDWYLIVKDAQLGHIFDWVRCYIKERCQKGWNFVQKLYEIKKNKNKKAQLKNWVRL